MISSREFLLYMVLMSVIVAWGSGLFISDVMASEPAHQEPAAQPAPATKTHAETPSSAQKHGTDNEQPSSAGSTQTQISARAELNLETASKTAISALRKAFGPTDQLIYLYGVDAMHDRIVLRYPGRLLVDPDETPLQSLLADERPTFDINVAPAVISRLLEQSGEPALPVYDTGQQLVGIVAIDKVMDAIRKSAVVGVLPAGDTAPAAHSSKAQDDAAHETAESQQKSDTHATDSAVTKDTAHTQKTTHAAAPEKHASDAGHGGHGSAQPAVPRAKGVAFIEAAIKPLNYELNERFWGWRPNDLITFTDNVNNFQLGVLEVTRRTAMVLAERVSRTGITASFDPSLENAMNWFMIKSDRFWFPAAESKYEAGLDGFREYQERLEKGEAKFYNRADNLIPLLMAYEDLLGSSEENLVKGAEEDGQPVSYFKADDYFFYAKGVVSALYTILSAVEIDFKDVIHSRKAEADLHHAIESCHHVLEINPILITNSDPSSLLANHRANLAAPLSHARFYLGVLIKTLST